jgi:hypothetical protein
MNKIFADHDDVLVHGVYVYVTDNSVTNGRSDTFVPYADKECTIQLTPAELEEIFLKGMVIYHVDLYNYYRPLVGEHDGFPDEVDYKVSYYTGTETRFIYAAASVIEAEKEV